MTRHLTKRIEKAEARITDTTALARELIEAMRGVILEDDVPARGKEYDRPVAARARLAAAATLKRERFTDYLLSLSSVALGIEPGPSDDNLAAPRNAPRLNAVGEDDLP